MHVEVFWDSELSFHCTGTGTELRWSGFKASAFTTEPSVWSWITELKGNFVSNPIRKDEGVTEGLKIILYKLIWSL